MLVCNWFPDSQSEQFYQRDVETCSDRGKTPTVTHQFVLDRSQATPMSEEIGLQFAEKLRKEGAKPWLLDLKTGRKIELPWQSSISVAAPRQPVRATLSEGDESNPTAEWYKVFPIDRPNGAGQWFIKAVLPGLGNPQMFYSTDPLECLRHARDLGMLQYCERAEAPTPPQPKPVTPNSNSGGNRNRPGDLK